MISKFPVISELGIEYLVEIEDHIDFNRHFNVYLFIKKKHLFGKMKFNRVSKGLYEAKEWGHDFVKMAKKEILDYEELNGEAIEYEKMISESKNRFEKWDGKTKPEKEDE